MSNKVKYFYNPSYSESEWFNLNPFLAKGQVGVELDGFGKAVRSKIGPGNWNDLEYMEQTAYPYADPVTNQIGDVELGSDQSNRVLDDIVKDMISPYQSVEISSAANSAAGALVANAVKEVGQTIVTSIDVSYVLSNSGSLKIGSNIFIEAGGIFTNEGWHTHTGAPITMLLASALAPTSNVTYTISLYAVDAVTGNTDTITTTITYKPAVLWGNSTLQNLSPAQIAALPNRLLANDYKETYIFSGANYSHIYIPAMLSPSNLLFSEVSNPSNPGGYAMITTTPSLITINNGTGTYDYYGYVSEYDLISASKMKID